MDGDETHFIRGHTKGSCTRNNIKKESECMDAVNGRGRFAPDLEVDAGYHLYYAVTTVDT